MSNDVNGIMSNLDTYISRKNAGLIILADQFGKGPMTTYAKTHAKWTDRTTRARNGLNGGGFKSGDIIISWVSHSVNYGEWLEKSNSGKYAILNNTIQANKEEFKRLIKRFMKE